ncbi:MAG: DUF6159 family protein [Candidatus Omnitrophota bacterium]|nr:DUF6159 family protein [Candidatus Omnitrophota bacterium]
MTGDPHAWELMAASWNVYRKDKEMILFSLLEWVLILSSFGLFMIAIYSIMGGRAGILAGAGDKFQSNLFYFGIKPFVALFLWMLAANAAIYFSTAAIVGCVITRFIGEDPTLETGFRMAFKRLPALLGWAAVVTGLRFLLGLLGRTRIEKIVADVSNIAFNLLSFFAVPVIIIEGKPPLKALARSAELLRETWGKQLVGQISFGAIFGVLMLPGVGLLFTPGWMFKTCGVAYLILAQALYDTLTTVFQTALYVYARYKKTPEGFDEELLRAAVHSKTV